jgi:NTE family protein
MKIGLALGGGGAKGMAHIGVLSVLESAGIKVDIIAGTSAGAIAGSLYAAGKSPREIETLVRGLRWQQLLTRDRTGMGIFSTEGIRRVLEAAIGKTTRIEDLPRRFIAMAVDMDSGEERAFDSGPVAKAVCASAAFPGLFAPVRIDGHGYFDGGVTNAVPFDVVRRRGARRVLAVDLGADDPTFIVQFPHRRGSTLFYRLLFATGKQKAMRVATRAIGIMSRQIRMQRLKESPPDLVLHPLVQQVGMMDFELAVDCIRAGEQAARDALPQIERVLKSPEWWYQSQRWMTRRRGRDGLNHF